MRGGSNNQGGYAPEYGIQVQAMLGVDPEGSGPPKKDWGYHCWKICLN